MESIDRRNFLKTLGVASAPLVMPALTLGSTGAAAQERPLRFGLVGYGGRGQGLAQEVSGFGQLVAICDLDQAHLDKAAREFPGASLHGDFRKLVEMPEVDAVVCATVDHWHAQVSVAAMRAGKDVYCEKPLTLTFAEGKPIIETVGQTGRILQVGSQQRSEERFRRACEVVRNGWLGTLQKVEVYIPEGPRMFPFWPQEVPEGFNWEFWKGQTPDVPYLRERTHGSFRYWWDYSGGTMTDWGAHHIDIAIWGAGLEESWPVTITGEAQAPAIPGGFTADSRFRVEHTFADGLKFSCQTTPDSSFFGELLRPDGQGHGVRFTGTEGWLWVTRGYWEASDRDLLRQRPGENDIHLYRSSHHMQNFVDCVRSREQPIVTAATGHRAAGMCHLGVIALRLGRQLQFEPSTETFPDDAEATAMLSREMRPPYDWSFIAG